MSRLGSVTVPSTSMSSPVIAACYAPRCPCIRRAPPSIGCRGVIVCVGAGFEASSGWAVPRARWFGLSGSTAVNGRGEHERVGGEIDSDGCGAVHAELAVARQESERLGVERDSPVLVGLRVLLPGPTVQLGDAPLHRQHPADEIEVAPTERAQLTPSEAGHHRQPHEHGPVRVSPCLVEDPRRFLGARWLRVRGGLLRRFCVLDRVRRQPTPAHGPLQRTAENDVNLPDRRLRERTAGVRPAAVIALVCPVGPMLGVGTAVAVRSASP